MSPLGTNDAVAFVEPSLIVHAFAPLTGGGADRDAAETYLRTLWGACDRLGMSESPLPGVDAAFGWPTEPTEAFVVLAARSASAPSPRRQALLFRRHDVLGLATALEDPASSKDLEGWRELLATWRAAVGDLPLPGALLGETFTFSCGVDAVSVRPEAAGPAVVASMRSCGLPVWDAPFEPTDDVAVWDGEDQAGRRIVAVLAPFGDRDELSRLFWWTGEREMPSMVRYQVHAAKLRYEERVHALRKAELDAAVAEVDRAVDEVLAAHRDLDATSTASLAAAETRLIEAQADSTGLVIQLSYLRALQRTVDIARHNMALIVPGDFAGAPETMIDRDRALASRLTEQIDHDIGYAEAVQERAQHATGLSSIRLRRAEQQLQAGRSRLVLYQTALLSALLTGIGAIATFELTLDVAQQLRLPLLTSLVTLLLAAPVVAVSWHDGFRPLDRFVIGLLGASLSWLVVVAAWPSAPWYAVVAAVAAGSAASQLIASRHARPGDAATR